MINPNAKQELRRSTRKVRRAMSKEEITEQSARLVNHLLNWKPYQEAQTVMMFLAMPDEPHLEEAIKQAWAQGKTVCVPFMHETPGMMDAALIRSFDDLIVAQYDLLVPNPATLKLVDPAELDLIVVPGVAYDRTGNRLGMGAGFYDRFLPKATKAKLIGAAWSKQIFEDVPVDPHDCQVGCLLTEEGVIACCECSVKS